MLNPPQPFLRIYHPLFVSGCKESSPVFLPQASPHSTQESPEDGPDGSVITLLHGSKKPNPYGL